MGREVAVERGERLPGAGGGGHLRGRVEPVEPQLVLRGAVSVVLPYPDDELAVRLRPPEPVAEASLHHRVERALAPRDIGVYRQSSQAVALDRDRKVPLALDEVPERPVAQQRELLLPMHGLAESQ